MRVRTRVRRFSVHVRKCTYVQNVLPRETQDAPPSCLSGCPMLQCSNVQGRESVIFSGSHSRLFQIMQWFGQPKNLTLTV